MTKITKLKNGLTIIVEKKRVPKVCIGVLVKTGLINETDKQNGISHFLEHMAFKGTATKTAKQLSEDIERLGGSCNAYTSLDHTLYHVDMLAEHWKVGLQFLADILVNSTFPKDEIEKERNVILQEIARAKDNPMHVFWERLMSTIYEKQTIGRSILGPAKNVEAFTRKDLINYTKAWYCPNNMIISICGDVNNRKVVKFIKELFGHLTAHDIKKQATNKFIASDKVFSEIFDQSMIAIVYNGPKANEKTAEQTIFENVLDGGMSCRLFQEVREKNSLCYNVSTITDKLKDSGFMGVYAGVKKDDLKKAFAVMKNTIESMKTDITDEEIEKAKNIALYKIINASENCNYLMNYNAICYLYGGKTKKLKNEIKAIKRVTKQQVFDFANEFITDTYACVATIHGLKNKGK